MVTTNIEYNIREFEDKLIGLVNLYPNLPWEVRRLALENICSKVTRQADEAIREELLMAQEEQSKEESVDAESIFEDKLGELPE